MRNREAVFSKDIENRKLTVVREFNAPLQRVWEAWTTSELLDLWWAPKPYKAETKTMNFKEGGFWLYCMVGPESYNSWCIENYQKIEAHKLITNTVSFCDEQGNQNRDFPIMHWKKQFSETDNDSTVKVEITFDKDADLEAVLKMGFQEGFTAGLDNLDDYLNKK
jgi:uncharacterized protein YndB with AHSA1/START domain